MSQEQFSFDQLPDILIQDPLHECAYLLPASDMNAYQTGPETWTQLDTGTVTFVIPDKDFVEEVPPFNQSLDQTPQVLIQYPQGHVSYYLTFEQLQRYRTEQPTQKGVGYGISFILPRGVELIEELPALRRSSLQSQEVGMPVLPESERLIRKQ